MAAYWSRMVLFAHSATHCIIRVAPSGPITYVSVHGTLVCHVNPFSKIDFTHFYILLRNCYALVCTFTHFYVPLRAFTCLSIGQAGAEAKEDVEGRLGLVTALDLSPPWTCRRLGLAPALDLSPPFTCRLA